CALIERARRHGVGVYLYLNEPRARPLAFFDSHPELRGVVEQTADEGRRTEDDEAGSSVLRPSSSVAYAALCTSVPEVQRYLVEAVAALCGAAPGLAGFFTITASENLTHCWSHGRGERCPRCGQRSPAALAAEVNACVAEGIRRSGAGARLIAWDWGWD